MLKKIIFTILFSFFLITDTYSEESLISLEKLKSIDDSKLSEDNKLNYKLKEFDLLSSIQTKEFPTYYLRLNQRGGIQSFYETGNRLVYSSKQDYFDWLERLGQFEENINNAYEINKRGLSEGYTQPN